MSKVLNLHIGSAKTGTTSIQQLFHTNRQSLRNQGFMYPGPNTDHHLLFFASNAPESDWERTYRGLEHKKFEIVLNEYFSNLQRDFKTNYDQVISSEYLFLSNPKYVKNIVNFLQNYFDEIKVYAFVRDPIAYFRSHQQQMLKARSYIQSPYQYKYDFKRTIETWSKFLEIKLIKYEKGVNSCNSLCNFIGIDFDKFIQKEKRTKKSVSIEHLALFEKINRHLYKYIDDQLNGKIHLKTLVHIIPEFINKPQLQDWVKPVIYQNHFKDIKWLNEEYGIDFLNEELEKHETSSNSTIENGKATVRDIYKIPSEKSIEKYEVLVIDALLKKLVQIN